jgi:hypothetical protein
MEPSLSNNRRRVVLIATYPHGIPPNSGRPATLFLRPEYRQAAGAGAEVTSLS